MSLTEFLLERIAEDEAVARAAHYEGQRWYSEEEFVGRMPECCDCGCEVMMGANRKIEAAHIAVHDPARVLAECAAKRAIVGLHNSDRIEEVLNFCNGCGCSDPCPTIRTLAAVYADHPQYRAEWRVGA